MTNVTCWRRTAIYRDEKQLIQNVQQASEELTALFEADRKE